MCFWNRQKKKKKKKASTSAHKMSEICKYARCKFPDQKYQLTRYKYISLSCKSSSLATAPTPKKTNRNQQNKHKNRRRHYVCHEPHFYPDNCLLTSQHSKPQRIKLCIEQLGTPDFPVMIWIHTSCFQMQSQKQKSNKCLERWRRYGVGENTPRSLYS